MMELSSRKDTREVEHGRGDISLPIEMEPEEETVAVMNRRRTVVDVLIAFGAKLAEPRPAASNPNPNPFRRKK